MGKIITHLLACFPVIFYSCSSPKPDNFYCYTSHDVDVWRLPIIEPIELVTSDNNTEWTLYTNTKKELHHFVSERAYNVYNADSINYEKNILFLHSRFEQYVVLNLDTKKDTLFPLRNRFDEYVRDKGLTNKLYSVSALDEKWIISKKLPWDSAIKKVPCTD